MEDDTPTLEGCNDQPTWDEVRDVLKSLPRNKACGIDGIPGELLKIVYEEQEPGTDLAKAIWRIIHTIWSTAKVPECLEAAVVVPVPKKGDLTDPDNYRGISLISVILKVVSKIATVRLTTIAERHGLIIKEQAGFRQREECVGQAAALYEAIKRRSNVGEKTYACFVDFSKAYDRVPHKGLLRKIENMGIGGQLLRVIEGLYENPKLCVRAGNGLSKEVNYSRGVRQGCPSSPILFDLYINDILQKMEGVWVPGCDEMLKGLLFADDAVILAETKEQLAAEIERVYGWARTWEMQVNVDKCGIMVFPEEDTLAIDPSIPMVKSYRYLGVQITEDLCPMKMAKGNVGKGIKTVDSLASFLRKADYPVQLELILVKAKLLPVVLYGAELWGMNSSNCDVVDHAIDSALRMCVRVGRSVSLGRLHNELGIPRSPILAARRRLRAFEKFKELNTWITTLMRERVTSRKKTWTSGMESWIKRYMGTGKQSERKKLKLTLEFNKRELNMDRSLVTLWAKECGITIEGDETPAWIRLGLSRELLEIGRMRLGIFFTGNRLVHLKGASPDLALQCPCCNAISPETLEHFLIDCSQWEDIRGEYLKSLFGSWDTTMSTPTGRPMIIGVLLGGECGWEETPDGIKRLKTSSLLREGLTKDDVIVNLAKYLAAVRPRRAWALKSKVGTQANQSSRTQGHGGTGALGEQ
jgi:hypothetical protein